MVRLEEMFNREGKAVDDLMNVAKVVCDMVLYGCMSACINNLFNLSNKMI